VFVAGGRAAAALAAAAPLIRRGKELRSELILRVFAVERFLRFLIVGGAAYGAWRFTSDRAGIQRAYDHALPAIRALYQDLGFNVSHSKLLGLVHHAFALSRAGSPCWPRAGRVCPDRAGRSRRAVLASGGASTLPQRRPRSSCRSRSTT